MKKIFASKKVYKQAFVTFGILQPTCEVDSRGNTAHNKKVIDLTIQIDKAGTGQGNKADTEAYATDERMMEGHLVKPARIPSDLQPGVIGTITFEDGSTSSCRLMPVSQISWRVIGCDRIRLAVGAGSIVRLT